MRSLSAFAMRGRWQAASVILGLALASLLLPPLSLLSSAILALVAMRKGALESSWVLAISVLAVGMAGALMTGDVRGPILYGLLLWAPVWPIALVLRATLRLDWAMVAAAVLGFVAVAMVYAWVDDPSAFWRERVQSLIQTMLTNAQADGKASELSQSLEIFSRYMTGAMAGGSVLSLILGLLIGRWQQAVLFNPGGFRSEFVNLRFRIEPVLAALACLAMGAFGSGKLAEIAMNMSLVFFVLFAMGGLAIVHCLLTGKGFWIVGFYMALLVMPQLLLPPLSMLGLSDVWLDWRKFAKRDQAG